MASEQEKKKNIMPAEKIELGKKWVDDHDHIEGELSKRFELFLRNYNNVIAILRKDEEEIRQLELQKKKKYHAFTHAGIFDESFAYATKSFNVYQAYLSTMKLSKEEDEALFEKLADVMNSWKRNFLSSNMACEEAIRLVDDEVRLIDEKQKAEEWIDLLALSNVQGAFEDVTSQTRESMDYDEAMVKLTQKYYKKDLYPALRQDLLDLKSTYQAIRKLLNDSFDRMAKITEDFSKKDHMRKKEILYTIDGILSKMTNDAMKILTVQKNIEEKTYDDEEKAHAIESTRQVFLREVMKKLRSKYKKGYIG